MNWNKEVIKGKRFRFGRNWKSFSKNISQKQLSIAKESIIEWLEVDSLKDKDFLDIGCGSGIFSLSAFSLGANVYSFDYDPDSVECTRILKEKNYSHNSNWIIKEGSILESKFLSKLHKFDIVYSWGVLHHTGNMWEALLNAANLCKDEGYLFISIYNDQGNISNRWKLIKKIYNRLVQPFKFLFSSILFSSREIFLFAISTIKLRPYQYFFERWKYKEFRGMNYYFDYIDWIGGYPFEVAKPEEVITFLKKYKFKLEKLETSFGGCNQFLFKKMRI